MTTETPKPEQSETAGRAASDVERLVMRVVNFIWPMCPSGLQHRVRGVPVTNANGNVYCWHKDCFSANDKDLRLDLTRCPQCYDKIVAEDDDARLCISCGGRNRKLKWVQ